MKEMMLVNFSGRDRKGVGESSVLNEPTEGR
jgi:hypothetical protein